VRSSPANYIACALLAVLGACTKADKAPPTSAPDAPSTTNAASVALSGAQSAAPPPSSASTAAPAPRAGMAWIPPGTLRAGTPSDRVPRIPDEELPGTELDMVGYYIDLYPYPNEEGAIPTVNVTREDATKACAAKGKRLCTEFEWERACKGPGNSTYEYGDQYRAAACGTGVAIEHAARRPNGEHVACKSGFGVQDLHGGVWEWTDSPWRRGSKTPELGVLRGGNARAGELVGRCANAIGRKASTKAATMGFRCCAGSRNPHENDLTVSPGVPLDRSPKPAELAEPYVGMASAKWGEPFVVRQAWSWHPAANEQLVVVTGCARGEGTSLRCGVLVGRPAGPGTAAIEAAAIDSGRDAADVVQFGEPRRLRMRGLDLKGSFLREIVYAYGRVDVGEQRR
jgi:sulfatase modifying factor 1